MTGQWFSTGLLVSSVALAGQSIPRSPAPNWTAHGHRGGVTCVAFSGNATMVASGGNDKLIKVWNSRTGRLERTFEGHVAAISSLAFSSSDLLLATGSFDQSVRLWNVRSGRLMATVGRHPRGQVKGLRFSPNGDVIASAGADGIRLWDVKTSKLLATLPGDQGVLSVAFSPQGHILAGAGGGAVKLWDVRKQRLLRTLHEASQEIFLSVAFSPDGRFLAGGGSSGRVRIWQVDEGDLKRELEGHSDFVRAVAFSSNAQTLLTADRAAARAWDFGSGRELQTWRSATPQVAVALSADYMHWAGGGSDGTLRVWKLGVAP